MSLLTHHTIQGKSVPVRGDHDAATVETEIFDASLLCFCRTISRGQLDFDPGATFSDHQHGLLACSNARDILLYAPSYT